MRLKRKKKTALDVSKKTSKPWLKKCLLRVKGLFPHKLPKSGAPEFDRFCDKIFYVYDLPDLPSYRHAIATMVLQLKPTKDTKSLAHFAKSVRKAMANQVAFDRIQFYKEEMQRLEKAAKEVADLTSATPN